MSPGRSDRRSTANFADSGLSMATVSAPSPANGAAAFSSMKAKVMASEHPAAVSTRRTS